ncbi:uncharacterized protein [Mytilus edulis]|uniref:uncharacterized protein isoform X1 n=2 Tax=Mytilus edulis TaxID=6550 RepID=UPI0039F0B5B9
MVGDLTQKQMMNHTNTTFNLMTPPSSARVYIIAPFAIITIVINVIFFVLGIKKLENRAHNMLIISLCGGNCLHGISLLMLTFINRMGFNFGASCISQITIYLISTSVTLTLALMICIERFVSVRLNNFGTLNRRDGWKKYLTIISLLLTTGYVIVCMVAKPRIATHRNICYLQVFYNTADYQIVVGLLSGLFVTLTLTITTLYMIILYLVFKIRINETKVAPIGNSNSETDTSQTEKRNKHLKDIDHGRDCIEFSSTSLGDFRANQRFTNPDRCAEAAIQLQIKKSPVKYQNFMLEGDEEVSSNHLERTLRHDIGRPHLKQHNKTKNKESMKTTDNFRHNEQSAIDTSNHCVAQEEAVFTKNKESMQTTIDFKQNEQSANGTSTHFVAQEEAVHKTNNKESMQTTGNFKHNEQSAIGTSAHFVAQEEADCYTTKRERLSSLKTEKALSLLRGWECRAITTAGYVIGSTLVLRGPMVLCMVFDAFGIQYDNAIRDITAILVALQCLIDPFVYAFRFQAIRKEIQKMICCKKEVTTSNIYIY